MKKILIIVGIVLLILVLLFWAGNQANKKAEEDAANSPFKKPSGSVNTNTSVNKTTSTGGAKPSDIPELLRPLVQQAPDAGYGFFGQTHFG